MKYSELSSKKRTGPTWLKFAAASLLAVALAGCGGGDDGAAGAAGPAGPPGPPGPVATTPATVVNLATVSADAWANLTPVGTVQSVAINGAPEVSFTVTDGTNPVVGLAASQLRFTIAKLVPGANGSPSKWVNYIVGNPDTGAPGRPTTDSVAANLVATGDGTYKYTFSRDITGPLQTKMVAWFADAANAASPYKKADVMGADGTLLDYVPALHHRLVIQLSGSVNNVALKNPINVVYDFIPATGQVVAAADSQREIVATAKCNECHDKIGVTTPHGGRVDTRYCVTCHTDQRKNGQALATSISGAFPALTKTIAADGRISYSPNTYVADGQVSGNFTTMIHKVHMGNRLTKANYNYASVLFNKVAYTQEVTNCTKCHDNSATSSAKTTQGDNWKQAPSILACGSCHDGINFATGAGTTAAGATTGHMGGAVQLSDDKDCLVCHKVGGLKDIAIAHAGVNMTPHNLTVPAGLTNFTYDVKTVTVNASNQPVVTFRVMKQTAPEATATPVVFDGTSTNSLVGFTGNPSFLVGYAAAQDGIATPVDFNNLGKKNGQPATVGINTLMSTLGAPDASGYYTVALTSAAAAFPAGAKLRTIALQGYYTQAAGTNGIAANTARHTLSSVKAVSGEDRRAIVEAAKCSNCHEVFEGHGGNRNIGKQTVGNTLVCAVCHNPTIVTSGRGISDTALQAFPFTAANLATLTSWGVDRLAVNGALAFPQVSNNFKDMIHGIHAGKARSTNPFRIARGSRMPSALPLIDGADITFVGILNNCQTCHKAGTYSTVPANTLPSRDEANNGVFLNGVSRTPADAQAALETTNATDLMTTPFTASCASCHDASPAVAHMKLNGGQILVTRSMVSTAGETCAVCHSTGKIADAAVAHTK
ncbi:MAG: OmcA/MtrC family decaheme c-type cytochrome [Rhodoferax sp.]|uniref:OmcA/MtrC family decaheme c-type cytochrome n=1 Tax=Rhodoferax sp. TaxID=50421 RepID=UPI0014005A51|nr:OmcA/MtrC family decaheme c-type cytochrome [Rhodoferax sp.]NDP38538.1 OmcA/MtrC family decaheme c-type cytochrome [Rhodoferax sp.]